MASNLFTGVIPALMTPCKADRTPDFDALARKGRELVSTGMSAVVYCGSMGDWPLLTDEQRMEGVARLVEAGLPVIVGTGAQNSKRAAALAAHAKRIGAKGLMIIPRVLSRGSSTAAPRAHFEGILLRLRDPRRAVLRLERPISAPRRLQGIRRREVAELRRRAYRGAFA
jgi:4-hydroxy-tetrahydrodipicolinate synthase